MEAFRARIADCRKCKLSEGRTQVVFGTGNPDSPLVFVGEAPGEEEDRQGYPFVGRAGQLLTKMIEAMGLKREEIYIANVIKCRPPKNRNPEEDEITSCQPFLWEQIRIIQPRIICALGKFAAQTLLKTEVPISQLRGKIGRLSPDAASGIPSGLLERLMVVPTFHPAYLLRNPSAKSATWKDLQLIMTELGITTPLKTKEEVRS
jgi:DNA polymerase